MSATLVSIGAWRVSSDARCERGVRLVSDGTWTEPHALASDAGRVVADEEHVEACGCSGRVIASSISEVRS